VLGGIFEVGGDVSSPALYLTLPFSPFGETGLLLSVRGLALGVSLELKTRRA
jgi:hypothetical protein